MLKSLTIWNINKFNIKSPPLNFITDNRISLLLLSDIAGPIVPNQSTNDNG